MLWFPEWPATAWARAEGRSVEEPVALFEALDDPVGLDFARQHADIIARFGRFPHRNKALGRPMLAEEQEFLDQGGFSA